MSNPIQPTPILKGQDAKRFLDDLFAVNEKYFGDPDYRSAVEVKMKECEKSYNNFMSKMR